MKKTVTKDSSISSTAIQNKIYIIRGQKVMLDKDLAELYCVLTKNLNKAVNRNEERFPEDFMFRLTKEEYSSSRFQIGTLKRGHNLKYLPYVFTEQGVAMLSSVLNSARAIEVNIQIMRIFTKLREMVVTHKELAAKLKEIEGKINTHDKEIQAVFTAIRRLMTDPEDRDVYKRTKIGFIVQKP